MATLSNRYISVLSLLALLLAGITACEPSSSSTTYSPPADARFRLVNATETGIDFSNQLAETVDFNIWTYMYFYNGGGVAAGDLNNDGLPELYFTSNQQPNTLYLNRGDLGFEDITRLTGTEGGEGWTTGVTMADVNADGLLDIYVCQLGNFADFSGKNQLFINLGQEEDGTPFFEEQAAEYGLDFSGMATQAAFFDYDLDGDLDAYLLNHSVHENGTFGKGDQRLGSHPTSGDRLLRNEGGTFVDVSQEAGIYSSVIGYGLGITTSDVNGDGYPDIYVGNDFHENDYLYLNLGDGTFSEVGQERMGHTSRFSMGNDIADLNNDGAPEIMALDMLPADPAMLKASAAEDPFDIYYFKLNYGYSYQFARNTLQVNNGQGYFHETGLYSGVAATDWSWSTLMTDLDLDGHKDIFVSNGILRRSNDLDYINYISSNEIQNRIRGSLDEADLALIETMPEIKLPNALYQNLGGLRFRDRAADWGLGHPSFSNGTVYTDLDNDGDWDLVINNVNQPAFIYENRSLSAKADQDLHYLKVKLAGPPGNTFGVGAKVWATTEEQTQLYEMQQTRGYQSAVEPVLIIGLGSSTSVDQLRVDWGGGKQQTLTQVAADQTLTLHYDQATQGVQAAPAKPTFAATNEELSYVHEENTFVEFNREGLVPHMFSTEGPALAVGDVNGDGLDDLYLGGAKWQAASLMIQAPDGRFIPTAQAAFAADSTAEDVDATFFDADQDGDQDLLVVAGGNEFSGNSVHNRPRLYLNEGSGQFRLSAKALPELYLTGATVAVADYDADGDTDVYLGARTTAWQYGVIPESYLLANDGAGNFSIVTQQVAPGLARAGFIKDAQWTDLNGDQRPDLVLAGEWMPISIWLNQGGSLEPLPLQGSGLEDSYGWWNVVYPTDVDGDGDQDLLMGNLGLNSKLTASVTEPLELWVADFDDNKKLDHLLVHYSNGERYLFATKDELTDQLVLLKKKFTNYTDFAQASFEEIIEPGWEAMATKYKATQLASVVVENLGDGRFAIKPLPAPLQWSAIQAISSANLDADPAPEYLLHGNFEDVNVQRGRYDAAYGWQLDDDLQTTRAGIGGVMVPGQVRNMAWVTTADKAKKIILLRNGEAPVLLQQQPGVLIAKSNE